MKIKCWIKYLLLVGLIVIFSSCESTVKTNESIVGSWIQIDGDYSWNFSTDGSYASYYKGGSYVGGTYRQTQNEIILNASSSISYFVVDEILTMDFPKINSTYKKE